VTSSTLLLILILICYKSFLKGTSGTNKFIGILYQMIMKFHCKIDGFLRIKTKILQRLQGAVDGTPHSQKYSVEANNGRSLAKVLTKRAVLMVSGLELAPRPGIFAVLDLHNMDAPLPGWELTGVPDAGRRLAGWCCC